MNRLLTGFITAISFAALALAATASAQPTVYRWGSYGGKYTQESPVAYPVSEAVEVDASNDSTMARTVAGQVYSWGLNTHGQLGDGSKKATLEPQLARIPAGHFIVTIGEAQSAEWAIDSEGNVFVWGYNLEGAECLPESDEDIETPVELTDLHNIVAGQGGQDHSIWINTSGAVFTCGSNLDGRLGQPASVEQSSVPLEVPLPEAAAEVSAGYGAAAVRTDSDQVYMVGEDNHGQIGNGVEEAGVYTPYHVPGSYRQVSVGGERASAQAVLALTPTDELASWGSAGSGQLLRPSKETAVPKGTGYTFVQAVTGETDGFAITLSGEGVAWGSTRRGQLGLGPVEETTVRTPVQIFASGVSQVSATAEDGSALIE